MDYVIEFNVVYRSFAARFSNGNVIMLGAETLEEAEDEIEYRIAEGLG